MPALLIAFASGVLACQFLPEIPGWPWGWACLLLLGAIAGLGAMQSRRRLALLSPFKAPLLFVLAFALGASYTCWRSAAVLADTLPEAAMGRNIRLTGVVDSLPDRTARGQRFHFNVEQVDSNFHVPERIQLSVWHHVGQDETRSALSDMGDRKSVV